MANRITLIGAYGRTYTNTDAMLVDWIDGKDFKIINGPYCSIRDLTHIVRFNEIVKLMSTNGDAYTLVSDANNVNPIDALL